MASRRITERRHVTEYGADGTPAFIGMWVDNVQIAAAIRQDDEYADYHRGARWSLWSSGLTLAPLPGTDASQRSPIASHPLPVRTEADVRAWLDLLADLAEHGARSVETRRIAAARRPLRDADTCGMGDER